MIQRSETLNGYREVRSEVIGIIKGSSFDSRIYGDVIKIRNLISTKYDKRYFAENISFSNEISYDYWSEYLSYFVKKEIFSYSTSLSNSIGSSVVTLTSFEVDPALAPARKRLVEKRSAYRRAWAEYRQGGGIGAARPAVDAAKANALFGEAFELYRSGDTTAALTKFDAGFKLDPDNGRGHLYAAEVAEKADQFERSAKHLMAAARFLAGTPDGAKAEAILSLKE